MDESKSVPPYKTPTMGDFRSESGLEIEEDEERDLVLLEV